MQENYKNKHYFNVLLLIFGVSLTLSTLAGHVNAQGMQTPPDPSVESSADMPEKMTEKEFQKLSPVKKLELLNRQLRSIAAELLADLGPNEMEQIYAIRSNHGVVQSVKRVENDLALGVKTCLEKNPEMTDLKKAFEGWRKEVRPMIDQAEIQLTKKIKSQEIVESTALQSYLRTIDLIATIQDNRLDKTYVSEKKQCNKLKDKLDETKEGLRKLLREALNPL